MYGTKMFFNLKEANVIQFKNRYQIKLGVIDDSDCAYFIIFDKEAKQVLGKSCIEILDPLLLDVDYTSDLLLTSKASSIIKGEKVEGAKELRYFFHRSWKLVQ
ncbi:uncharacterized protein [Arachis hypogaea]|uniref:uncharacterized protein isoform X2 n=1 Tax=Arachis hypogaea TaxID=3818 RepID=UPI003B2265E1